MTPTIAFALGLFLGANIGLVAGMVITLDRRTQEIKDRGPQ